VAEPFLAEIRMWALNFAPRGWAFCDGQLMQIAQNTALFSLVGTTYGGDGRTTLGLPNLQGRTAMHSGNGPGLSSRRLGQRGGEATVALSAAQGASHNHRARGVDEDAGSHSPAGRYFANTDAETYRDAGTNAVMQSNVVGVTGGGQPHGNMQPFLGINYCIALTGLYPSRS
jgi:microcystin-dependent protein